MRGSVRSRSRLDLLNLTVIAVSGANSTALTLSLGMNVLLEIELRKVTPVSSILAISKGTTSPVRRYKDCRSVEESAAGLSERACEKRMAISAPRGATAPAAVL